MTNAISLLHRETQRIPDLPDVTWDQLEWDIRDGVAVADLCRLQKMYTTGPAGRRTLILPEIPPTLPIIDRLHRAGWARSTESYALPGWLLAATLTEDGATVRIQGLQFTLPDGTDYTDAAPHAVMDYWSPPPPPPGRSAQAMRLAKDWNDRLTHSDWDGWTATASPYLTSGGVS